MAELAIAPSTESTDHPEGTISAPEVMKSGAGFYVGTYILSEGFWSPHSRFSDYWKKREGAEKWLADGLANGSL